MASLNGVELQFCTYDTAQYPFRPELTRAAYERYTPLDWKIDEPEKLEGLHDLRSWLAQMGIEAAAPEAVNTRETDQRAQHYDDLYTLGFHALRPDFKVSYLDFIENEVQPHFDEPIVFQSVPTLRVHMPGNVAVGEYHKDTEYGHAAEAVNFWVPVTDASGSNTIHIQKSDDAEPQPVDVKYGEYIIFDGVGLLHGNEVNTTGKTRVSFDLRVIPESKFKSSDEVSINTGLAFKTGEGGYYSLLTQENLAREREKLHVESAPQREYEARLEKQWAEAEIANRPLTFAEKAKRAMLFPLPWRW